MSTICTETWLAREYIDTGTCRWPFNAIELGGIVDTCHSVLAKADRNDRLFRHLERIHKVVSRFTPAIP